METCTWSLAHALVRVSLPQARIPGEVGSQSCKAKALTQRWLLPKVLPAEMLGGGVGEPRGPRGHLFSRPEPTQTCRLLLVPPAGSYPSTLHPHSNPSLPQAGSSAAFQVARMLFGVNSPNSWRLKLPAGLEAQASLLWTLALCATCPDNLSAKSMPVRDGWASVPRHPASFWCTDPATGPLRSPWSLAWALKLQSVSDVTESSCSAYLTHERGHGQGTGK